MTLLEAIAKLSDDGRFVLAKPGISTLMLKRLLSSDTCHGLVYPLVDGQILLFLWHENMLRIAYQRQPMFHCFCVGYRFLTYQLRNDNNPVDSSWIELMDYWIMNVGISEDWRRRLEHQWLNANDTHVFMQNWNWKELLDK